MENRIDTTSNPANKGVRGGWKESSPDPNELLIQLITSGIRLQWSPHEHRVRNAMGLFRVTYHDPVSLTATARSSN